MCADKAEATQLCAWNWGGAELLGKVKAEDATEMSLELEENITCQVVDLQVFV